MVSIAKLSGRAQCQDQQQTPGRPVGSPFGRSGDKRAGRFEFQVHPCTRWLLSENNNIVLLVKACGFVRYLIDGQ
jgi:hypothetical protein